MSLSYEEYEEAYRELAVRIASDNDINLERQPGFGRDNKVMGASGHPHQIDVSLVYISNDGKCRQKLIECKLLSGKVNLQDALIFHARINDIQGKMAEGTLVEGNLVTTEGYTRNAKNFADFYKIATNTLAKDLGAGSISFADKVVIMVRTAG